MRVNSDRPQPAGMSAEAIRAVGIDPTLSAGPSTVVNFPTAGP